LLRQGQRQQDEAESSNKNHTYISHGDESPILRVERLRETVITLAAERNPTAWLVVSQLQNWPDVCFPCCQLLPASLAAKKETLDGEGRQGRTKHAKQSLRL
jgi:hypothetical protein